MRRSGKIKDMAFKADTDLGEHFIRATGARTHRVIGADQVLEDGNVIKIVAGA